MFWSRFMATSWPLCNNCWTFSVRTAVSRLIFAATGNNSSKGVVIDFFASQPVAVACKNVSNKQHHQMKPIIQARHVLCHCPSQNVYLQMSNVNRESLSLWASVSGMCIYVYFNVCNVFNFIFHIHYFTTTTTMTNDSDSDNDTDNHLTHDTSSSWQLICWTLNIEQSFTYQPTNTRIPEGLLIWSY